MDRQSNIAILGCGESGTGAAMLAKKQGWNVFVSDIGVIDEKYKSVLTQFGIEWEEGKHTEEVICASDIVVKSPGIPDDAHIVVVARKKEIPVISEIEFAGAHTNAKIIAVTGTNGKTTTVNLIYHILKKAGLNVGLAGNVGKSFARMVAEEKHDYYVLELSSYQLDGIMELRPDIAVLLNITPDHLDRYGQDLGKYVESKFRITKNFTGNEAFIYCKDDENIIKKMETRKIAAETYPFSLTELVTNGAYLEPPLEKGLGGDVRKRKMVININQKSCSIFIEELALQGKHNIYNTMAATIPAFILNIKKDVIRESLMDFTSIEHRMEFVVTVHGIDFINDSKGTNANSSWYALECMTRPVIWIAGGREKKGSDYSILNNLIKEKVKAIICIGEAKKNIRNAFTGFADTITDADSIEQAVTIAYELGVKGDVVLLSPACASFDMYKNFDERGRRFKHAAREL